MSGIYCFCRVSYYIPEHEVSGIYCFCRVSYYYYYYYYIPEHESVGDILFFAAFLIIIIIIIIIKVFPFSKGKTFMLFFRLLLFFSAATCF